MIFPFFPFILGIISQQLGGIVYTNNVRMKSVVECFVLTNDKEARPVRQNLSGISDLNPLFTFALAGFNFVRLRLMPSLDFLSKNLTTTFRFAGKIRVLVV